MMSKKDVFSYLGVADRETLLSGLLAWLLDPGGSHGLGTGFLMLVWRRVFPTEVLPQDAIINVEDREGRDKRFDISVCNSSKKRLLVLEVKCKTNGTARQLESYADKGMTVWRIGFAEWNWVDLDHKQQERFPLITFSVVALMMKEALRGLSQEKPYRAFIEVLAAHLEEESCFFAELEEYFFGAGSEPLPAPRTSLRHSSRFYNLLYWKWFKKRLDSDRRFRSVTWKPATSETSGVLFATHPVPLTDATTGWVRRLVAVPVSPVFWWVKVELKEGLPAQRDTDPAGRIQLHFRGEKTALSQIYDDVSGRSDLPADFLPAGKRPGRGTFSTLTRRLTVKEFRYPTLVAVIALLLDE